jgi:Ca2+-binding RTX toxin-like protein
VRGFVCRGAISTALLTALLLALLASSGEARPRCHGHKATIVGGGGANRLHGTARPDVIVGGGGRDRIAGRGGFDLICAGAGDDVVLGGPGGDTILGGSGDDALYGGLQDDKLVGAAGNDLLIGGEAYNTLLGGSGDDYNREGFTVNGGEGSDWLSFATNTFELMHYGLTLGTQENHRQSNLENVVGTRFADTIYGGPAGASGTVRGLGSPERFFSTGVDRCFDFAVVDCGGPYATGQPMVLADTVSPDPGVTVVGGRAGEHYSISQSPAGVRIDGPPSLMAGPGCSALGSGVISCRVPGRLGYILAFGNEGDDSISIEGRLNRGTEVVMDGGEGGDTLRGGPEDDRFEAGDESFVVPTGSSTGSPDQELPSPDTLIGGGGDDSLMAGYMGPDRLFGGSGTDQLATWSTCSGGVFDGGPGGSDIANFVYAGEVRARLGGVAVNPYIKRFEPCTGPVHLANSIESLEGGRLDDVLIGNDRGNFIAGHEGDDVIKGMGGNDHLVGEEGSDRLVGGGGSDHLDCGSGGGVARRDSRDSRPHGCH